MIHGSGSNSRHSPSPSPKQISRNVARLERNCSTSCANNSANSNLVYNINEDDQQPCSSTHSHHSVYDSSCLGGGGVRDGASDEEGSVDSERSTPPCMLWAKHLSNVLNDEEGLALFKQFLICEVGHVNELYFWYACEGFKKLCIEHNQKSYPDENSRRERDNKVVEYTRSFCKEYIAPNCRIKLSCLKQLRLELHKVIVENPPEQMDMTFRLNMLNKVQSRVEEDLRVWHSQFVESDTYINYINQILQQNQGLLDEQSCGGGVEMTAIPPDVHAGGEIDISNAEDDPDAGTSGGPLPTVLEEVENESLAPITTSLIQPNDAEDESSSENQTFLGNSNNNNASNLRNDILSSASRHQGLSSVVVAVAEDDSRSEQNFDRHHKNYQNPNCLSSSATCSLNNIVEQQEQHRQLQEQQKQQHQQLYSTMSKPTNRNAEDSLNNNSSNSSSNINKRHRHSSSDGRDVEVLSGRNSISKHVPNVSTSHSSSKNANTHKLQKSSFHKF